MKIIDRFILWYLARHHLHIEHDDFVVRMFTKEYYSNIIKPAEEAAAKKSITDSLTEMIAKLADQLRFVNDVVKGGSNKWSS